MEPIKRELGNHAPMVSFSGGLMHWIRGNVLSEKKIGLGLQFALRTCSTEISTALLQYFERGSLWVVDDDRNPWVQGRKPITGLEGVRGDCGRAVSGRRTEGIADLWGAREKSPAPRASSRYIPSCLCWRIKPEYLEGYGRDRDEIRRNPYALLQAGHPVEESIAFGDGLNDMGDAPGRRKKATPW